MLITHCRSRDILCLRREVFSIQYSRVNHNALYLPSPLNFALALSLISLGTTVIPRKNWKHGLCKFWWINKVHYYVRESAEYNN